MRYTFNWLQGTYASLAVILIIAAAAILAAVSYSAETQNRASIETQQKIAQSFTRTLLQSLGSNISTEAYWQEAYDSVVTKWDQKWVDWNYGAYLDSVDIPVSFVYGPHGEVKFHHVSNTEKHAASLSAALNGSYDLVRLYGDVRKRAPSAPPLLSSGFLSVNGEIFYGAAGYVIPEQTKIMPRPAQQHVVVFLKKVLPAHYSDFASYYRIGGLEIRPVEDAVRGKVWIPLHAVDGRMVAKLWWTPYMPGVNLMETMMPLAIGIFAALGVLLFFILRTWQVLAETTAIASAAVVAAKEESRAKTNLLAGVSHELRTPLNAIIGFSDTIRSEVFGPIGNPRYREYITHIFDSGGHLLRIINDLLDLAKMEANETKLSFAQSDVRTIITQACDMLQVQADRKSIVLDRPTRLTALTGYFDEHALLRILINVLGNALKFTDKGGRISIILESDFSDITIRVRDNGMGIKPQDLEKIGRPFMQATDTMHTENAGTGLGLSISKALLELMHGTLKIESVFGSGTTVSIVVPRSNGAEVGDPDARKHVA